MKTFLTDGFDKSDFEKLITGLAYIILVIAIVYMFVKHQYTDYNIIGMCVGAGGLFVARKGLSYFKPERYDGQNNSQIVQEPIQEINYESVEQMKTNSSQTNEMPKGY